MKIFAASAGGLRPKDTRGHFFLPEEGGFGAFSVSSARGFLCGRSALKYKGAKQKFLIKAPTMNECEEARGLRSFAFQKDSNYSKNLLERSV